MIVLIPGHCLSIYFLFTRLFVCNENMKICEYKKARSVFDL